MNYAEEVAVWMLSVCRQDEPKTTRHHQEKRDGQNLQNTKRTSCKTPSEMPAKHQAASLKSEQLHPPGHRCPLAKHVWLMPAAVRQGPKGAG